VSAPLSWDEVPDCVAEDFTLVTMPPRYAAIGDRHADIDLHAGSLDALLEASARHERDGLGDAPWPPQYRKRAGEPPRVQPSKRRKPKASADDAKPAAKSGRRTPKHPLIEIGRARKKEAALEGLERWRAKHPDASSHLEPADVLVDAMRGRYATWTRIRVNLRNVPEALRPVQEPLDPDEKIFPSS
jgi:hypothetical protein